MSVDVMIDLETTGVIPGCAILTMGACSIDEKDTFYAKISLQDCMKHGLVTEAATMAWWDILDVAVKEDAFSGTEPLVDALGRFADWLTRIKNSRGRTYVWGNGADFDLPILAFAYNKVGMSTPWEPYNGRCFRTLKNLYRHIAADPFVGIHHSALDDAINQSRHMLKILRAIKDQK